MGYFMCLLLYFIFLHGEVRKTYLHFVSEMPGVFACDMCLRSPTHSLDHHLLCVIVFKLMVLFYLAGAENSLPARSARYSGLACSWVNSSELLSRVEIAHKQGKNLWLGILLFLCFMATMSLC